MARKPRIHFSGALYHVTLRGNDRQLIFFKNSDRSLWEAALLGAIQRYQASIHCYCWMTNHVHMLVKVSEPPLGATIRYAASQYARKINFRERRTGHLFERRHSASLVSDDNYLMGLVRYMHNNPVRAGMVVRTREYPWSSHAEYAGQRHTGWLTTRTVLRLFGSRVPVARQRYLAFMDAVDEEGLDQYRNGRDTQEDPLDEDRSGTANLFLRSSGLSRPTLDSIIDCHLERHDLSDDQLTGPSRARFLAGIRTDIAVDALQQGVSTIADLARRLNRSESAISQAVTARKKSPVQIT